MKTKHLACASLGVLIALLAISLYLYSSRTEQIEQIELPYRLIDNLSQAEIDLPPQRKDPNQLEQVFTLWTFPDYLEEWKLDGIAIASEKEDSVLFVCQGKDAEIVSPRIEMPISSIKEIRIGVGVDKKHLSDEFSVFATFEEIPVPFKLRTIAFAKEGIAEYRLNTRTSGENDPRMAKQLGSLDRLKIVFHSEEGAQVEIRHIKIFAKDHWYRVNRCGVSREALESTWRDYIYSLCPSELAFDVTLPEDCLLDVTLGNLYRDTQIAYQILVRTQDSAKTAVIASHSLPGNDPCKQVTCDLSEYTGKRIKLILKAEAGHDNHAALWGNPTIYRNRNAGRDGPNVILYVIDTLRADHLSCYGYGRPTSPHIDSLADKGVLFERCIAQAPWTAPSAASYLSSLYPTTHKVSVKQNPEGRLLDSMPIIPEVLKKYGFVNAAFISNPMVNSQRNLVRGYDSLYYIDVLNAELYAEPSSKILSEQIASWLKDNHKKRFFLYVHAMDPHEPYDPPSPYDTMFQKEEAGAGKMKRLTKAYRQFISAWKESGQDSFEKFKSNYPPGQLKMISDKFRIEQALYDGEIAHNDYQLGKLIQLLKQSGIQKDTILIVIADHGEEFFEKGFRSHGHSLHSSLVHVPLIFHYPPLVAQGKRISRPVQLIDVFPSLLDLLDIVLPKTLQGHSLAPLMGDGDCEQHLGFSHRGEFWNWRSFTDMIPRIYGDETHCLVDRQWKAVYRVFQGKANTIELYDLDEDHGEKNDLSATEQALARQYEEILVKRISEQEAAYEELHRDNHSQEETLVDVDELRKLKSLGYVR